MRRGSARRKANNGIAIFEAAQILPDGIEKRLKEKRLTHTYRDCFIVARLILEKMSDGIRDLLVKLKPADKMAKRARLDFVCGDG